MNHFQKFVYLLSALLLFSSALMGQYWQQQVSYDMDLYLDSQQKLITAHSNLQYINHSPDALSVILMHLYPNAFNEGTIAQQVWQSNGEAFDLQKGWTGIKIQQVKIDSTNLEYQIRDDTILEITLAHELVPGDTLNFSLDWTYRIHPHIDRSGWEDEQFDLSQWYPKFVVYDEWGWHDDPFGDWGEFYGEFGNFTVHLDLPIEQIVGATGVVVSGDPGWQDVTVDTSLAWSEWLPVFKQQRSSQLEKMDSTARRQVTFFAENVHDFAWLCSPDMVYEHGAWNGIDVNALFTTKVGAAWTKTVLQHGIAALKWLSENFGAYPWPQMTITKALLGGGMEYPMLVMDASDSETLIVHEIGHNWFYGLFGNDELDDAWLDEGFTTFQTRWYQEVNYPDNDYALTRKYVTPFEAEHLPRQSCLEGDLKPAIRYMQSPRNEPIATPSYDFVNYGSYRTNVYTKTSLMLHSLKAYLGEQRFLDGMQLYYQRWALKHVNEERFTKAMEDASGEELDWFFDQWLHTTKFVDYALDSWQTHALKTGSFNTRVEVKNLGGLFVPVSVAAYGAQGETATATLKAFRFRNVGTINIVSSFKPVAIVIDPDNVFLDVNRINNYSKPALAWRYDYKGWDAYPSEGALILWKPRLGFNDHDGIGLGINLKRVYRNTGNFSNLSLDYNLKSQQTDYALTFRQQQRGLPFAGTWSGTAGKWRGMTHATLTYQLKWAQVFWAEPIHSLQLGFDYTAPNGGVSFGRFKLDYTLQTALFEGDLDLQVRSAYSPDYLGSYGEDFQQLGLAGRWDREIGPLKLVYRSNLFANGARTPQLVQTHLATPDKRKLDLDRGWASLHQWGDISAVGLRYYLAGGGRLRAYTDQPDTTFRYLWSDNVDLSLSPGIKYLKTGVFFDGGQISPNGSDWEWRADAGVSLSYRPRWKRSNWLTTLVRPFSLSVAYPLLRVEQNSWVSTASNKLWVFSISNH